jgi:DNA-directed RNA polymerase subunit RPC12/RpoP
MMLHDNPSFFFAAYVRCPVCGRMILLRLSAGLERTYFYVIIHGELYACWCCGSSYPKQEKNEVLRLIASDPKQDNLEGHQT